MINFLNMKYFLVVAEARSFSAAAKQLYISPADTQRPHCAD